MTYKCDLLGYNSLWEKNSHIIRIFVITGVGLIIVWVVVVKVRGPWFRLIPFSTLDKSVRMSTGKASCKLCSALLIHSSIFPLS